MLNKKISVLIAASLFMLGILACSAALPQNEPASFPTIPDQSFTQADLPKTEADVPRLSVEDAMAALERGEAIVVDVRSLQSYSAGHIPGAISIPLDEIEVNPNMLGLDKGQWIITYCT